MLQVKDTTESTNKRFSVIDINRRARAAYRANRSFFDSQAHQAKVNAVDNILRNLVFSYTNAYQTARPQTRRKPAHTEVKYDRVVQYSVKEHNTRKQTALAQLEELGLTLVYKPRTNSYSVHVA